MPPTLHGQLEAYYMSPEHRLRAIYMACIRWVMAMSEAPSARRSKSSGSRGEAFSALATIARMLSVMNSDGFAHMHSAFNQIDLAEPESSANFVWVRDLMRFSAN